MLTREAIARFEVFVKENFSRKSADMIRDLATVKYLRKQLDHKGYQRRWKVVTLVRDPVARNISAFMGLLDLQMHYGLQEKLQVRCIESVLAELRQLFLEEYSDHDLPLTFFDSEVKSVFGIDVFSTPFPKSKGYTIYEGENADVLLLRLEDLDGCAREAFQEFLEVEGMKITKSNTAAEKDYATVYPRFLRSLKLPNSYLKKMYNSKYATHFYTKEEIRTLEAKWRT